MILKTLQGDSWRMFDDLHDIQYRVIPEGQDIGCKGNCYDLTYRDSIPLREQGTTPAENEVKKPIYEIWARTKTGDMQILAHEPIYLLNDEGKTIEKL